jgi:hypothetical protein
MTETILIHRRNIEPSAVDQLENSLAGWKLEKVDLRQKLLFSLGASNGSALLYR